MAVIVFKEGSKIYDANRIRLDPSTMLDAQGDPTLDVALAVTATSFTDPSTGQKLGGVQYEIKIDHVPVGADEYAFHATMNNVADPVETPIEFLYICTSKPGVALVMETMLDKISSLMSGVQEFVSLTDLRNVMNDVVTACGYTGAVMASVPVLTEVGKEDILAEYRLVVIETGWDAINYYGVTPNEDVVYKLVFENLSPDGVKVISSTRKDIPIKMEFVPAVLFEVPTIVFDDPNWVASRWLNVEIGRRFVTLDPNKIWTLVDYTSSTMTISTKLTEARAITDVATEMVEKASV